MTLVRAMTLVREMAFVREMTLALETTLVRETILALKSIPVFRSRPVRATPTRVLETTTTTTTADFAWILATEAAMGVLALTFVHSTLAPMCLVCLVWLALFLVLAEVRPAFRSTRWSTTSLASPTSTSLVK